MNKCQFYIGIFAYIPNIRTIFEVKLFTRRERETKEKLKGKTRERQTKRKRENTERLQGKTRDRETRKRQRERLQRGRLERGRQTRERKR